MDSQFQSNSQTVISTEDLIRDFFFILFSPNPAKESVRVIVDDGTYKVHMKIPKFVKIINSSMGDKAALQVKNLCSVYGGFFLVDRVKGTITQLHLKNDKQILNIKQLHKDIEDLKSNASKEDIVRERFLAALQAEVDSSIEKGSVSKPTYSKYSSTVIYGNDGFSTKNYRPY